MDSDKVKILDAKISIAEEKLAQAYAACAEWEKLLNCAYYRRQIASAQGWLTRRENKLQRLRTEKAALLATN